MSQNPRYRCTECNSPAVKTIGKKAYCQECYTEATKTTMDDLYGDGSQHEVCEDCGSCIECDDCRCES